MTRSNILKKFFKKFFNMDVDGNGVVSVFDYINRNYDELPIEGGGATNIVNATATGSVRTVGTVPDYPGYSIGSNAFVCGSGTRASGTSSHAEGAGTTASGQCSHAEGAGTTTSGSQSHAEGSGTTASGNYSHAEGSGTTASGQCSHAEGGSTTASGEMSHAGGGGTIASGRYSHAEGNNSRAQGFCQTVIGKYNIAQGTSDSNTSTDYAFIIGNGNSNTRSNALAIKWDGTIVFANGTAITPAQFSSLLRLLDSEE